jgi:hypothetical protein
MKNNKGKTYRNMSLKQLAMQLRCLGKPEAPEKLKQSLIDSIPTDTEAGIRIKVTGWLTQCRDIAATIAAALIIGAMLIIVNQSLPGPSQIPYSNLYDTSLQYPRWDLNGFMYDFNNSVADIGSCPK